MTTVRRTGWPARAAVSLLASACSGGLHYYEPPPEPTTSLESPTTPDEPTPSTSTSTETTETTEPTDTEPTNTEPTDTTDPIALALTEVDPSFGSNAGRLTLRLDGTFDAQTVVQVDGVNARIVSQRATRIEVELPASTTVGPVDVAVHTGNQTKVLNDAFQYFEDVRGEAALVGNLSYLEYLGDYWSGANHPRPLAWGELAFTAGPDWTMDQLYAPATGDCEYEYSSPASLDPDPIATGAANVQLTEASGAVTFRLANDTTQAGWFSKDLDADTQVMPATTYSLEPVDGNSDWPDFDLPRFVRVPGSFNVSTPRLNANQLQPQGRTIDLEWSGSGGDYMLIYVRRTTAAGADNGYVTCVARDTGSFRIPSATWPNWPTNNTLYFQVGRVLEQGGTLPHNDGDNRVAGIYWVYGAAYSE